MSLQYTGQPFCLALRLSCWVFPSFFFLADNLLCFFPPIVCWIYCWCLPGVSWPIITVFFFSLLKRPTCNNCNLFSPVQNRITVVVLCLLPLCHFSVTSTRNYGSKAVTIPGGCVRNSVAPLMCVMIDNNHEMSDHQAKHYTRPGPSPYL